MDARFVGRWFGRGGLVRWPLLSPDLSSIDYFLWGHLEGHHLRDCSWLNLGSYCSTIHCGCKCVRNVWHLWFANHSFDATKYILMLMVAILIIYCKHWCKETLWNDGNKQCFSFYISFFVFVPQSFKFDHTILYKKCIF